MPTFYDYSGPCLEEGAFPAVFYFALSAKDSLYTDPFNQPVTPLAKLNIRVFSFSLPFHETFSPHLALEQWTFLLHEKTDFLTPFFDEISCHLQTLYASGKITKAAVMGLSRGGLIAAHLAARFPWIEAFLGFAPVTSLTALNLPSHPFAQQWDLSHLSHELYLKKIRFYIGNCDRRVDTKLCFNFLHGLAQLAEDKKIRSAPIEMKMTPSIGRDGHGTSKEAFEEGALWLASQLH